MALKGEWSGLAEAVQNIMELGHEIASPQVLIPATKRVAAPLRDEIVRTAPRSRDTEHMADTFIVTEHEGQVLIGPHDRRGSVGWIAPFVEFGTSKMRARPFIRPAFDAFKGGFPAALTAGLQQTFRRLVKRRAKFVGPRMPGT